MLKRCGIPNLETGNSEPDQPSRFGKRTSSHRSSAPSGSCNYPHDRQCDRYRSLFFHDGNQALPPISGAFSFNKSGQAARCHSWKQLSKSQRKRVTILFSDVAGYTSICENIDPEDVRKQMSTIFATVVSIILAHGGHVERIVGDAVMAVFGIPQAHDSDAFNAVRAALVIHRQVDAMGIDFNGTLAQPLAMHSGIASGQVVTGKSDHDPCGHGITGHAVAQASYLRDMAENGEILLCRETAGATSESYALDPVCIRKDRRQSKGFVFKVNDTSKTPLPVKKSLERTVLLE